MKFELTDELINAILSYLAQQPWLEVDPLITGIRAACATPKQTVKGKKATVTEMVAEAMAEASE